MLSICVACHGHQRPLDAVNQCITVCFRASKIDPNDVPNSGQHLVQHKGFFATSAKKFLTEEYGHVKTLVYQGTSSLNPIGKNISLYSRYANEDEVLFPPNTEFVYVNVKDKEDFHWLAKPVRTANPHREKYIHGFSDPKDPEKELKVLKEIQKDKLVIQLNTTLPLLAIYLKEKTKPPLLSSLLPNRFFSTSDIDKNRLEYFKKILDLIGMVKSAESKDYPKTEIEKMKTIIEANMELDKQEFFEKSDKETQQRLLEISQVVENIQKLLDIQITLDKKSELSSSRT